jgi:REP element-mobilizing transposase RayT
VKHTLGQIVAYFKYQSSKRINLIRGTPGMRLWQRNYFEHIIRNEESLNLIREYILTNPLRWHLDKENPHRDGDDEFDRWFEGQST